MGTKYAIALSNGLKYAQFITIINIRQNNLSTDSAIQIIKGMN